MLSVEREYALGKKSEKGALITFFGRCCGVKEA